VGEIGWAAFDTFSGKPENTQSALMLKRKRMWGEMELVEEFFSHGG
jgi:hypothetical protein